ncbi:MULTISPECIES: PfkB family carbohydrate kinase [unclassified Actinomadura]|uniref:carbohydrate kinase family protein n=1 Tax=unclassified Actinomadura TaxID=2626254 RepID=UPI0011EC1E2B|nr:PfkB family carbohydrate kinase [Actinomadura sp. K4S16]
MAPPRSPLAWPGLDGVAERRFALFVVGDAGIEVRASLPGVRFAELGADRLCYAPARLMAAGTAVNLARCAVGYFRRVDVLAKVGDDDYTEAIRRELCRIGAADRLVVEPGVPNGVSVMLRDDHGGRGPGVRLLVVQDEPPARRLTAADVRAAAAGIEEADVLAVDGYALLAADSRAALHEAVRTARAAGTRVAFDVVPHDIDARLPASCVLPVLEQADLVVSEAHTLARLLGHPPPADGRGPQDLLPVLDRAVPGAPLWLLRFGPTSLERVLAHRRGRAPMEYPTGYAAGVRRAGFGDRLTSCELYWWLSGG